MSLLGLEFEVNLDSNLFGTKHLQVKSEFCRPLTKRHGLAAHKVGLPRSLIQISDLAKILS